MVSTSVWDWAIIGVVVFVVAVAFVGLTHRRPDGHGRAAPTVWSAFPAEAAFGIVIGWLCAAVAVIGLPAPEQAAVFRSLVFVAGAILFGVPLVWRQRYLEARLRHVETEGLYERLDDTIARDLHETFLRLCKIQRALNGLTRAYHVKNHALWVAEQLKQNDAAASIKKEMRELELDMVLEFGTYDWEMLSVLRRLSQTGHVPDPGLSQILELGPSSVADIDAVSKFLHDYIRVMGPVVW
jgi:hypothetical protein